MNLTAEQKEMVFNYYSTSLDLSIAILKTGLTPEEEESLMQDEDFMLRIKLEEAQVQIDLVTGLRSLAASENEPIKLRAILELGKMNYKKKFNLPTAGNTSDIPVDNKPVKITMKGVAPQ